MNMTDDDKLSQRHGLGQDVDHPGCSEEEAEFEATPRASKWGGNEKQDLHYLLPLKGSHGRLIHQEPAVVAAPAGRQ